MRIDVNLFKGFVNKNLTCVYVFQFEESGQYQTIRTRQNGNIVINPCYGISISEGYEKNRIYLPANKYAPFVSLLEKTTKLVQENLYEIFPDINNTEFEVDNRVLQRFQTEKAMTTAGITMSPSIWVDEYSQTYPGIRVNGSGFVTVPLEDAISLLTKMKSFDPDNMMMSMLRMIGKIE
jgi:hypothetical protein